MSLHGSGRFARRRDSEVNSSGGSIHSNFSVQRQQPTYEPGTGGHFMAQSGWHNRDAYGKAKTTTTTIHPNVGAGVFVLNSVPAVPLPSTSSPSLSSHPPPSLSGFVVPPSTSIVLPAPPMCELYIEDQANNAYNDTDTFEYNQAMQIVQSAITSTLDGSTLRDLTPIVTVNKIENGENDLRVLFCISIVVIPQSSIRADSIENVFKKQNPCIWRAY
uniref:Uncharacterized protein n=1 Tax=Ditylenchus dipsaci TaxID=166011 RepID=A0A915ER81_9BILA